MADALPRRPHLFAGVLRTPSAEPAILADSPCRARAVIACPFCSLIATPAEAHVVLDEAAAFAFLDRRPLFGGHVLVVPRAHIETLVDLPPDAVGPFFRCVQRVARAVEVALDAAGTFVAINNKVSQSVPHLHVHVVPRRPKDGLKGFFWPRTKYASGEEAASTAARIRAVLRAE